MVFVQYQNGTWKDLGYPPTSSQGRRVSWDGRNGRPSLLAHDESLIQKDTREMANAGTTSQTKSGSLGVEKTHQPAPTASSELFRARVMPNWLWSPKAGVGCAPHADRSLVQALQMLVAWLNRTRKHGSRRMGFYLGWAAATMEPVSPGTTCNKGNNSFFDRITDTRLFPARCGLGTHVLRNTTNLKSLRPQREKAGGPHQVDVHL